MSASQASPDGFGADDIPVVLATSNPDKVREFKPLLQQLSPRLKVCTLSDLDITVAVEETETTLEGNARLKADAIARILEPRFLYFIALADDTGLEVHALHGEPGVRSARFAPSPVGTVPAYEDNVDYLLARMLPFTDRSALFRTVIALMGRIPSRNGAVKIDETAEGVVHGSITTGRRGSMGFGYDPLFLVDSTGRTYAEMSMEEKNRLSHRALAIEKALAYIHTLFETHGIQLNESINHS